MIRAAPIRALLGYALSLPAFFLGLGLFLVVADGFLEILLTLLSDGLSGLDQPMEGTFLRVLGGLSLIVMTLLIPVEGLALKALLIGPLLIVSVFLFLSAYNQAESNRKTWR